MAIIDAKTNFMLLMCLINISPKEMAPAIGTDATLISRWHTGKRRLIAGRPWIKKVSTYFVDEDERRNTNCIPIVMSTLYPNRPCGTRDERIACVTQFLLCPGQLEFEYRRRRYEMLRAVLPGRLKAPKAPEEVIDHIGETTRGKQKLMAAVMEYLGVVGASSEPQRMIIVSPEGLNPLIRLGPGFTSKLLARLMELFGRGHTLAMVVDPAYQPEGSDPFKARLEGMHMRGYVETHYCNEFKKPNNFSQALIMTTKHDICVSVTLPDNDSDRAQVLTVKSPVTAGKTYFMALKLRNRMPEKHKAHVFEYPDGFLSGTGPRTQYAGGMYCLSELPLFGLMNIRDMATVYGLTIDEVARVERELWPLTQDPTQFSGPVRHVLCREEIERALFMSDATVVELSKLLGRNVRIGSLQMVALLRRLLDLLNRCDRYEIALLPRHVMEPLGLRACIVEDVCAISCAHDGTSVGTIDPGAVTNAYGYGDYVWKRIPPGMKSRTATVRAILGILKAYEQSRERREQQPQREEEA